MCFDGSRSSGRLLSRWWDGGEIRYLNAARHSETLRQFTRSLKHPILLDEQAEPVSTIVLERDVNGELASHAVTEIRNAYSAVSS